MLKALILRMYPEVDFEEFLNVADEELFAVLGGKLFQTFTTCSVKCSSACSCDSIVYQQLERVSTSYSAVAIGRPQYKEITCRAKIN